MHYWPGRLETGGTAEHTQTSGKAHPQRAKGFAVRYITYWVVVGFAGLLALSPAVSAQHVATAPPDAGNVASREREFSPRVSQGPVREVSATPAVAIRVTNTAASPRSSNVGAAFQIIQRPSGGVFVRQDTGRFQASDEFRPQVFRSDDASEIQQVPGLGFDYPHLAATRGASAVGGGRRSGNGGAIFPLFGGGVFYPEVPVMTETSYERQPAESAAPEMTAAEIRAVVRETLVGERDAERIAERAAERVGERAAEQRGAAAATGETPQPRYEPQGHAEPYVFVRRDGTIFFAVAYAWERGGPLRYVTTQGLRLSATPESIDLEATQRFNEERGLNFR
ncbi:MAG: hypothetical protein NVS9B4_21030 [Candidatus Acidiferrum sp.]